MGSNPLSHIIHQVAQTQIAASNSDRTGTVSEIKGNKMRVNIGNQSDGTPYLSPWLHTSNHRGGSKDHQQYAVGQNVRLSSANGDMRQASVAPYATSKAFPAPAQMPQQPNGDYTQTGGNHFETKTMSGTHNSYISNEDHSQPPPQPASGQPETGGGGSSSGGGQQQQAPTAKMINRMDPEGWLTMRGGNDDNAPRMSVHEKGVKIRHGENTIFVDKDGVWCTKPMKIKKDGIPNDNKTD
jgi:hypothetical protein